MRLRLFSTTFLAMLSAAAPALLAQTSYDSDGYDSSAFSSNAEVISFEEPLGLDPVYSTPTHTTSSTPDTKDRAFIPTGGFFEYFGKQSIQDSNASLEITSAYLTLPLLNASNAALGQWHFDLKANMRITWINSSGDDLLDESTLYTMGLSATAMRPLGKGQVVFGVTPQVSSDLDVMSSYDWFWGMYGAYAFKWNDKLNCTLGISYMPHYHRDDFLPLINLSWKFNPHWEARIQSSRFSVVNTSSERFEWGPFFQYNVSAWTVKRNRETQQLRMRNCLLGLGSQLNLTPSKASSFLIIGDIGASIDNKYDFRTKNGNHSIESYKGDTGFYARVGFEWKY